VEDARTSPDAGESVAPLIIASALRERFREGYSAKDLRADVLAGLVVAMVAMPLGMALAIASGVAPQHGLYTVIVAGTFVAALGGSRFQVTGPTAAFVVVLAPVVAKFGLAGLLTAGLMAGALLVVFGLARLGKLITFVPYPVTTGFTAGIALVIAAIQVKDLLGLDFGGHTPEGFLERIELTIKALPGIRPAELAVGAFTLAMLAFWPARWGSAVPAPLAALVTAALLALGLERAMGLELATIATRFHYTIDGVTRGGIPPLPPLPVLPWNLAGPEGRPFVLDLETIRALLPSAIAIAFLGAIETLLSAVVADAMGRTRHDPDAELLACGIGNILCPFLGGIPATGAIARTATNIRSGAQSPLASVIHAQVVVAAVLFAAPLVGYLPMAALAGLLLRVAWNISEAKHFAHMLKVAPRHDIVVLLTCFALTVLVDMVAGVSVGVILAALLFMRRMASLVSASLYEGARHPTLKAPLAPGVMLYEIAGPLFFGAAQRAVDAILTRRSPGSPLKVVIFFMANIPTIDITGLVALESSITALREGGTRVILVGVTGEPFELIHRARLDDPSTATLCATLEEAVALADSIVGPTSPDHMLTQSGRWMRPNVT